MSKNGLTLVELVLVVGVLGLLWFPTNLFLKRYLVNHGAAKNQDGSLAVISVPTAEPWKLYSTYPPPVAAHLTLLTQWGVRPKGPGGPRLVTEAETAMVKKSVQEYLGDKVPSDPYGWMICSAGKRGNAVLAGGLFLARQNRQPLLILKNDGSVVDFSDPAISDLAYVYQALWNRPKQQQFFQVGIKIPRMVAMDKTKLNAAGKAPSPNDALDTLLDGKLISSKYEWKKSPMGYNQYGGVMTGGTWFLTGGITDASGVAQVLGVALQKDPFEREYADYSLNGETLSELHCQP